MSLDPGTFPRADSPASSDSSFTRSRLRSNHDEHLKKDKNYRRYASTVERALSLFDTTLQEWADYISFLSRLLKALQSHPPDLPVVPHKVTVAKRLAQCLNPSLPSGVHQKALEVYTYIFGLLKPEGLSQDLSLYFPGVAPTLTFASLSVRPLFISLLETYLPELEPIAIRPALKAIILALLPGLEEETSDDFEATLRTLNKIRSVASQMDTRRSSLNQSAGGQYFWQCLFLASITNPSRRLGVLAYLNRHLPKLGLTDSKSARSEKEEIQEIPTDSAAVAESVISPEPGLLIRCFASGLTDDQLLVQRNFLDLLVTHLPLHSPILQSKIRRDDFERLILAAAGVVSRRDMSLNRRLWSWFLGPEPTNATAESPHPDNEKQQPAPIDGAEQSQSQYFSKFGLDPLVRGIIKMINQGSTQPAERSKPLRIALSLMDRWEVGGFVVPAVFLTILRNVQEYEKTATKPHFEEVFRSASAFFDGVESGLIFSELLYLINIDLKSRHSNIEKKVNDLKLAHFILANFNVREEEMVLIHVPLLTLSILTKANEVLLTRSESHPEDNRILLQHLIKLLNFLLNLLPERSFLIKAASEKSAHDPTNVDDSVISHRIREFYDHSRESLELPPLPFAPRTLAELILRAAHHLSISSLKDTSCSLSVRETLSLLVALLKKTPKSRILSDSSLINTFHSSLKYNASELNTQRFSIISSVTSTVTALYGIHSSGYYIDYQQICDLIPILVSTLWTFLSPKCPKFHVEAVRCMWLLHSITWQDHLVEASITSLMVGQGSSNINQGSNIQNVEKFFVLWNHSHQWQQESSLTRITEENPMNGKPTTGNDRSLYQVSLLQRPLFITLDSLSQPTDEVSQLVRDWIQDMPAIQKVLYILVSALESLVDIEPGPDNRTGLISPDGQRECHYLLQTLSNVIAALSQSGWVILLSHSVSPIEKARESTAEDVVEAKTLQTTIAEIALALCGSRSQPGVEMDKEEETLQRMALLVLRQLLLGFGAEQIVDTNIHIILIEKLSNALDQGSDSVQSTVIETLLAALKAKYAHLQPSPNGTKHKRAGSKGSLRSASILSMSTDRVDKIQQPPPVPQPPEQLLDCLLKGISSPKSRGCLEKWILLLSECLPFYGESIFQILLMLVECFCREVRSSFSNLQEVFKKTENWAEDRSEYVTIVLLTGLETCIATAHERLHAEVVTTPTVRSPDQPQGFFGNMVSNVFQSDGAPTRNVANDRLTVLLCFQDAVRLCFSIWSWGASNKASASYDPESAASFQYTSLRMRNRSRRLLEHLFTAEALESLETLVELWCKTDHTETSQAAHVFNLLHTLDRARPKVIIPAIFNAIYSRTNPAALDPNRKSALASNISESELSAFLVTYARSLDDDVLDEIWGDCTTFLRDVLANPFPHRQILSRLVEFAGILGTKMENTSFGDDRRMRKELGDLLLRLLAAIFTSKPMGLSQDSGISARQSSDYEGIQSSHVGPDDMLSILTVSLPAFITTLGETDRITNAVSSISTNVISPIFRSRLFPNNVNKNVLQLLQQISKISTSSKVWKKDIGDAFNDPRFFGCHVDLVKTGWMGLLRQLILVDKERFAELLSRLTPPATAGIMFGVGASAARLEADRKTQLNLRRIALLILSNLEDQFVTELPSLVQKLEDLLQATHSSSPSSATRAEIFMVLRALLLKTSTIHLAPFWPLINTELQEAIYAVPQHQQSELYQPYSLLQACKLLDTLLLLVPDDFQLQEWLFVTDTIDAIYPPGRWEPVALADEVSRSLGTHYSASPAPGDLGDKHEGVKKPTLNSDRTRETAKDEIVDRILKPFFGHLSIQAFESTYGMGVPDLEACTEDLLADLFNESTMAS
ncbi:cellular morphogenesis regulator dopa [Talaromyces proteolyticus]|uniref:Cellular morphogenesis regulator dopa n=1 Tax=Talaromyces proteolyticus TaxID=1131652 RepID=A0AAD4L1B1_9EURO|nr:cellular morphogenesis regulator dopa [Talaromyces proteolyticus]KAH8704781.1 cellular morphogenesis regulator dopa [Talaromyces proteolyticus]